MKNEIMIEGSERLAATGSKIMVEISEVRDIMTALITENNKQMMAQMEEMKQLIMALK
jgi:hypothetical protein